jgi:hypothetical protein
LRHERSIVNLISDHWHLVVSAQKQSLQAKKETVIG